MELFPKYLTSESDGKAVHILPSKLTPNGYYTIQGPGEDIEIIKKDGLDRFGPDFNNYIYGTDVGSSGGSGNDSYVILKNPKK